MYQKLMKYIKSDNKGATIVTVLVAVSFLVILGAILLFMSYTGFRLKAAQAIGENRFYDAETAMNEVRAGVQDLISESIADAFTDVLLNYSGPPLIIDKLFMSQYQAYLTELPGSLFILASGTELEDYFDTDVSNPYPYIGYASGGGTLHYLRYDINFLRSFLTDTPTGSTTLTTSSDVIRRRDISGKWEQITTTGEMAYIITSITLRGLRAEHISDEGYLSVVETDITLSMPSLEAQDTEFGKEEIWDYAVVATGQMTTGGNFSIDGNVYVGNANFTNNVTLNSGRLVSGGKNAVNNGDITVLSSRWFTAQSGASVWMNNLRLGNASSSGNVQLMGNTYAAASLFLSGDNSAAILGGTYYGFGTGIDPLNPTGGLNADFSSSIIANSKDNTLNLDNLNVLFLAGQSFISANNSPDALPAADTTIDIATGQSMAVKSDQLAYFVPLGLIEGNLPSNPVVLNDEEWPVYGAGAAFDPLTEYRIDFDGDLWGGRTLAHYVDRTLIATPNGPMPAGIQPVRARITGTDQYLFFLFMRFTDFTNADGIYLTAVDAANSYFRDYFSFDIASVRNYTRLYLDGYSAAARQRMTSSNIYDNYTGGNISIDDISINSTALIESNAELRATRYENLRITLSPGVIPPDPALGIDNPFDYVVRPNTASTPAYPSETGFYLYEGTRKAYVHSGGSPLILPGAELSTADIDTVRIIISDADVYVNPGADFKGLILCRGNIVVSHDIKSFPEELADALMAENNGHRLDEFLIIKAGSDSIDIGDSNAWGLSGLVYYDNWRKS